MGQKRSFDEEGLQELFFKHPKQLNYTEHATSPPETNHPYGASQKADIPVNVSGSHSKDNVSNAQSEFNDKEFKPRAPGSWGISSTMEEDMGSRTVLYSSVFPELFEFSFPRRSVIQFEDTYSSLLNSAPRKEVPIGPDHQADVPVWDPTLAENYSIGFTDVNTDYTRKPFVGSSVIPMPELESSDVLGKTIGKKLECSCLDGGSVRCVQQHVNEAREELKEAIGLGKFVDLGFLEMGEEVAYRWTEEEEQMFHEVVYSNPVSHGRNFWVHLSLAFPTRSKKELVSYYFNVFMLRRRAAQNRSSWLDIDSDDDEWRQVGGPFGMEREDEKLAAISFDQDVRVDHGDDSQNEYDDDSSSDGNGDDNDDGDEHDIDDNGDDRLQFGEPDATDNMEGRYHSSKGKSEYSLDDHRVDHIPHNLAKSLGSFNKELLDVREDSCESIQPCVTGSDHPSDERVPLQGTMVNSAGEKILDEIGHGSTDKFGPQYALESCESKVWDVTYPVGLMTSFDLLPTCNMMEEIFGPCNWNKSSNDKSVS
ncbi:hypothetical protein DCAR_0934890 [Daucus carota subsp. sativus]|uniref:Myb-like domain-containing protein n=1 Tax=Daucus carota subsp. sativus TaxID=79200 RepID=A0AAF1BFV6_DAUCS|nr:hypothetical protein DCAR_0934890 [Daucus carota subsp. sativus]